MSPEEAPRRNPLSFWETVGANVVAGVVTGAVTTGLSLIAMAAVMSKIASAATRETMVSMGMGGQLPPQDPRPPQN